MPGLARVTSIAIEHTPLGDLFNDQTGGGPPTDSGPWASALSARYRGI